MSPNKSTEQHAAEGRHRLDKWLWCARFYKTRSMAAQAIAGGKIHLNGTRIKPAHEVRIGDRVTVASDGLVGEFAVAGLPLQRGAASMARLQYVETPASVERRALLAAQQHLARVSRPRSELKPDKRERRALHKLHRDQG